MSTDKGHKYCVISGLTVLTALSVVEFSILNYVYLIIRNFLSGTSMNSVLSGIDVFRISYPLLIINLTAWLLLYTVPLQYLGVLYRRISFRLFLFILSLAFWIYLLIIPACAFEAASLETASLLQFELLPVLGSILSEPEIMLRSLLLLGFLFFSFTILWRRANIAVSGRLFGQGWDPLDQEQDKDITRSGLDFLELLNIFISNAQRSKGSLALMGIRIENEMEYINHFGFRRFQKMLLTLYRIIKNISRASEEQMLYHGNLVISMLISDKEGALLAADRFQTTIDHELSIMKTDMPVRISIGIFGYRFDKEPLNSYSPQIISQSLIGSVIDASSRAQDQGSLVLEFTDRIVKKQ